MASERNDLRSDEVLLARSREGDSAAFGELWERHRLAGIVAARGIAPTLDPDDLVSGAYLKIFELVRDGRGPTGAFRPYLYRVISSLAADSYRSPELSSSHLEEVPDLNEAGPWEDGAFDLNAAARAFESLPERWQSVLWYTEVEGMAPRQVAPLLGLSANGVSALAARAKEGLQSAWVETHIDMQLRDEACRATREQLQRHQLGKLTARRNREVAAHIESCDSCAAAAAEFSTLNKKLALVLATIIIGSASAGSLLKALGIASGVGAIASGSTASAANVTAASTAGGAGTFAGMSIGAALATVGTTAAIAALAVGGVLISQAIHPTDSPTPVSEFPLPEPEPATGKQLQEQNNSDSKPSVETSSTTPPPTNNSYTNESTVTPPRPPTPTDPPKPPTPPTLLAGYQCFVPVIDANTFELTGHASHSGTVEILVVSNTGIQSMLRTTDADGNWTSGVLSELDGFTNGMTTAQVRLISNGQAGAMQSIATTQCAGTGLELDVNLTMSNVCYLDPQLSGNLSDYGVLFARHVAADGTAIAIVDPQFDGVLDPTDQSTEWFGIFTGSDPAEPYAWLSWVSLNPYIGTVEDYNEGNSGTLELRIQTPDNRSSAWIPLEQLVDC